jgi:hypothetical protein|tara:strand:- start:1938 stop:2177 length:240 start_codon:yes stop_codon:yes gene_type:complete
MLSFAELREKTTKLASGEKQVKAYRGGKRKKLDVVIAKKGNKFSAYIDGERLDDNYKNAKDAEKSVNDFIKLMGEEIEV